MVKALSLIMKTTIARELNFGNKIYLTINLEVYILWVKPATLFSFLLKVKGIKYEFYKMVFRQVYSFY